MANELKTETKVLAVSMLAEGNSIRSIERMTGIHRDTVMRLGVRIGEGCQRIMDEKLRNQTVWEGVVESFALTGHPKAKRCYAWSYQDNGETQYVNVLEIPPVISPKTAVQAAIASGN